MRDYVCHLPRCKAPRSRAPRFLEALGFAKGLLGAAVQLILDSSRIRGAAEGHLRGCGSQGAAPDMSLSSSSSNGLLRPRVAKRACLWDMFVSVFILGFAAETLNIVLRNPSSIPAMAEVLWRLPCTITKPPSELLL